MAERRAGHLIGNISCVDDANHSDVVNNGSRMQMEGSMDAVGCENLTKRYKDVTAVDGLSLTVEEGELFALL